MADTVPRRGVEDQALDEFAAIRPDHLGLPGIDNGQNTVFIEGEIGSVTALRTGKIFVFDFRENIFCIRKSWNPTTIQKPGIPTDMICMQMRQQDIVDRFRRYSDSREPFEIGLVEMIESGKPSLFVIANPGISGRGH